MSQRRPTQSQLEANTELKIMQKPLFFQCFFNISRKSLEAHPGRSRTRKSLPKDGPGAASESLGPPWKPLGRLGEPSGKAKTRQGEDQRVLQGNTPGILRDAGLAPPSKACGHFGEPSGKARARQGEHSGKTKGFSRGNTPGILRGADDPPKAQLRISF